MIKIYNTLSKEKTEFTPINKGELLMYQCGPTVYDTAHIGNLRTYITNDLIRRVFEYNGYKVTQAMNITDIDDKTIRRSMEQNMSLKDLTHKYEELFFADIEKLNILKPNVIMRASEFIPKMIKDIEALVATGFAYKADDGIYFSIKKSAGYGKLVGLEKITADAEHRINNDEYDKENQSDFALWKFWTEKDGDNSWEAPFGKGRPGWHIECSTMSVSALGKTFDLHTGAVDLTFPHHVNEMAQSEALNSCPLSHYWMHAGFMNVEDVKMAKSKNNFIKLSDIEEKKILPLAYRYLVLNSHYRTTVNFTWDTLSSAFVSLKRMYSSIEALNASAQTVPESSAQAAVSEEYNNKFIEFISDDINIPKALALTHDLLADKNISPAVKRSTILAFDAVLGLGFANIKSEDDTSDIKDIPENVIILAEQRKLARAGKDWKKADELRKAIKDLGFEIVDKDDSYLFIK